MQQAKHHQDHCSQCEQAQGYRNVVHRTLLIFHLFLSHMISSVWGISRGLRGRGKVNFRVCTEQFAVTVNSLPFHSTSTFVFDPLYNNDVPSSHNKEAVEHIVGCVNLAGLEFLQPILKGCRCMTEAFQYHLCSTYGGLQAMAKHRQHTPGILGLISGNCRPFHSPLFSPKLSLFQREARVLNM